MIDREMVHRMIDKEEEYAKGWNKGDSNPQSYNISGETGDFFSTAELIAFAEEYLADAKTANQNFCPDRAAVRIRVLKAVVTLFRALYIHGEEDDPERIAGVSQGEFPILKGGLRTFEALTDENGKFDRNLADAETIRLLSNLRQTARK